MARQLDFLNAERDASDYLEEYIGKTVAAVALGVGGPPLKDKNSLARFEGHEARTLDISDDALFESMDVGVGDSLRNLEVGARLRDGVPGCYMRVGVRAVADGSRHLCIEDARGC